MQVLKARRVTVFMAIAAGLLVNLQAAAIETISDPLPGGAQGPEVVVIPAGEFRIGDASGRGRAFLAGCRGEKQEFQRCFGPSGIPGKAKGSEQPDIMSERVYLDWNATAPLRPQAKAAMATAMEVVGNPSSVHAEGRTVRRRYFASVRSRICQRIW